MIIKLTLLSTTSENHPMNRDHVILGYSRDTVEPGHPILLWYGENNDSRYLRTSRVNSISEADEFKNGTFTRYQIVKTQNSVYRVDEMKVSVEEEAGSDACPVPSERNA